MLRNRPWAESKLKKMEKLSEVVKNVKNYQNYYTLSNIVKGKSTVSDKFTY